MLPHHASEIERLRKQHHFMSTSTDGLLLAPSLTAGNEPLKVLDAGCADGRISSCSFPQNNRLLKICRDLASQPSKTISRPADEALWR